MQDNSRNGIVLPTGSWLAQERQRLGKTLADVAHAVQRHIRTVRALEQNNRVIPPGWCQDLRKLGMQISEPVWPIKLQTYCGADLHNDLQTRVGFRNSRYWLSKQLCVTEEAVTHVIQQNLIVPPCWLLKLAELGANVPAGVRVTLYMNSGVSRAVPDDMAEVEPLEAHPELGHDPGSFESTGPQRADADGNVPAAAPLSAAAPREQASVYMHWTQDQGLHFSMSAALLEQMPAVLKDLLIVLAQIGQQIARPGQSAPTQQL